MFNKAKPSKSTEKVLEDLAGHCESGWCSLHFGAEGFWSQEVISLYIRRNSRFVKGEEDTWEVGLSNSSGGRDPNVIADDLTAMANFADAIKEVIAFAQTLDFAVFEQSYQNHRNKLKQEADAKKAADEAAFNADIEVGTEVATQVIDSMVAKVKSGAVKSARAYAGKRDGATHTQVFENNSGIIEVSKERDRVAIKFGSSSKTRTSYAKAISILSRASKSKFEELGVIED